MSKKKLIRVTSVALCGVLAAACVPSLAGCKSKKDAIVIMTEDLSGLFNPFYATSGTDMDVVGMTQIGMLSTNDAGLSVAGDEFNTVAKAYDTQVVSNGGTTETVYTFVIKNGLKFSDGTPLTMDDVLFNMYEYLDPVYTGSSTMYSIDIKGLSKYRLQSNLGDVESDKKLEEINKTANSRALDRITELSYIYELNGEVQGAPGTYSMSEAQMREAIGSWTDIGDGYKNAIATAEKQKTMGIADYQAQLLKDYDFTLSKFKEELKDHFRAAKESFDLTTPPYAEHKELLKNDIFKFFLYEDYITPEYQKVNGRDDRTKIVRFNGNLDAVERYNTEEAAIQLVYDNTIKSKFNEILSYWGTAGTLRTKYAADATEVLLAANKKDDGTLQFPKIDGIVSLGHETSTSSVTIKGVTYKVASLHDPVTHAPVNADEYDVLQVTINGEDPKAIYNFSFGVAPVHYYSNKQVDIKKNEFGVEYGSSTFQTDVIQSPRNNSVPMGAGAYQATDKENNNNPKADAFWSNNVVYYKANENFMFDVKTKKLQMRYVSSANALDALQNGEVDYVTPQFTNANFDRLKGMKNKGFEMLAAWQLGYGYIGINAGKVPNVYIRRAIMSAMETSQSVSFYAPGTCETINWPMSNQNWAYPYEADGKTPKDNNCNYMRWGGTEAAKKKIENYMKEAKVVAGDSKLKIKFTIAGASITEHPTYNVFKQAAEILNDCGWQVEVKADSQALTKLSTGSLEVWAAAWGSTIDPDMYQVYHKNSNATSVYAWGYREIKANPTLYSYENGVINNLSAKIEDARSVTSQSARIPMYEEAMRMVLDLAVEMPVYQRKNLYAYNSKTIKGLPTSADKDSMEMNPYSSPLEKIWELELV